MRVALLALGGGGMLRYGLAYADALSRTPGVEVLVAIEGTHVPVARGILGQARFDSLTIRSIEEDYLTQAALPLRVLRAIREFSPHVVHDTTGVGWRYGPFVWPLVNSGTPLFITLHDPTPHSGMGLSRWVLFKRQALRHYARKVVVHGNTGAAEAIKSGVKDEQIVVSQHGQMNAYDLSSRRPAVRLRERDGKTVLFFGAFRPNKGMDLLPAIAERVHSVHRDVRFLVAGSSVVSREHGLVGWNAHLEKLLADMRSRPYFEVRDEFIPDEEVPKLFEQSDVVLLPYRDASHSGVLMTALALGRPIVATNTGGLGEVIQHGHTGWLVECSPGALADALVEALSQRAQAEAFGRNAKLLADSVYSWEAIASDLAATYRRSCVP